MKEISLVLLLAATLLLIAFYLTRKDKSLTSGDVTDMTFTLNINGEEYPNDEINASIISDVISAFSKEHDDFIILEPKTAIEQSIYIQSASPYPRNEDTMPVEIRFEYPGKSFKHYRYMTDDKAEIIQLFIDYWKERKVPDLTNWVDVSDELR